MGSSFYAVARAIQMPQLLAVRERRKGGAVRGVQCRERELLDGIERMRNFSGLSIVPAVLYIHLHIKILLEIMETTPIRDFT